MNLLWREDRVTYRDEEFRYDVSIIPKPVQDGGPDIWLGGGAAAALRRAATMANGRFVDPRISFGQLAEHEQYYRDRVAEADRESTARPLWREVFAGETTDDAIERTRAP